MAVTRDQIDSALLLLLPEFFEENGARKPTTLTEIEEAVVHYVLSRVHVLLKHGVRSGALHIKGRTYELVGSDKLIAAGDEDSNVVHVENWGYRRPHLMAGPDTAQVYEFPVRTQLTRRPSGDDAPEAG